MNSLGTYYKDIRAGCFQEYVVVPEHTVSIISDGMTFESAACLGVGALTAAMTLWKWLDVPMPSNVPVPAGQPAMPDDSSNSEYTVIWGGGSVTGQFATQMLAKAGMKSIIICSRMSEPLLRERGATHIITRNGKTDDELVEEIMAVGEDKISRAIDLVGAETAQSCVKVFSKTAPSLFAPLAMMEPEQNMAGNVRILNIEMKRFVLDESSAIYAQELNALVASGDLQLPELDILYGGLDQVEEGLRRLKKGNLKGCKLVVSMNP